MTTLTVWVPGAPIPQGSKALRVQTTASGRTSARMYDSNPRLKTWRTAMRVAIEKAMADQGWGMLVCVPIRATLTFTLPAPQTVAKTLKRQPAPAPAWRGYDLDKITRAALDSLTDAGAWDDDSRVTHLLARKHWAGGVGAAPEPGLMLEVREQYQEGGSWT